MIDVWNAEHQGYIRRTRVGMQALGIPQKALEILIFQPVALKLQGSIVEGGMAGGNTILLADVREEVGAAAARFFYLRKPAGATLEFDLDLARRSDPENPFAAVMQALQGADEMAGAGSAGEITAPAQTALLGRLAALPDEIRAAAREREPARLTRYATEVAAAFGRVRAEGLGDPALGRATATVLRNALRVIGAVG
jgi:arginyl-tRNA synthetase